jgi:hypothetical protein
MRRSSRKAAPDAMPVDRTRENAVIRLLIHALALASVVAACSAAVPSAPRLTPSAAIVPTGSEPCSDLIAGVLADVGYAPLYP